MYNRGTLRPAQPDPVAGAKRRVELTEYFSRKNKPPIETGGPDLRRQVFRMFQHEFGDTVRWSSRSERRLWQNLRRFSSDELRRMIATDPKTWADLAKYQASDIANGNAPEIVMELAWQDSDGNWHNPFWYR